MLLQNRHRFILWLTIPSLRLHDLMRFMLKLTFTFIIRWTLSLDKYWILLAGPGFVLNMAADCMCRLKCNLSLSRHYPVKLNLKTILLFLFSCSSLGFVPLWSTLSHLCSWIEVISMRQPSHKSEHWHVHNAKFPVGIAIMYWFSFAIIFHVVTVGL